MLHYSPLERILILVLGWLHSDNNLPIHRISKQKVVEALSGDALHTKILRLNLFLLLLLLTSNTKVSWKTWLAVKTWCICWDSMMRPLLQLDCMLIFVNSLIVFDQINHCQKLISKWRHCKMQVSLKRVFETFLT